MSGIPVSVLRLLGPFLDSNELASPIALESAGPFVDRFDCFCVGTIERLAPVASHFHQADVQKHPEVLGDRRLREAEPLDDGADGALGGREEVQDVSPAGFGDGVEAVGGRGGAGHEPYYMSIWEYVNGPTCSHSRSQELERVHGGGAGGGPLGLVGTVGHLLGGRRYGLGDVHAGTARDARSPSRRGSWNLPRPVSYEQLLSTPFPFKGG